MCFSARRAAEVWLGVGEGELGFGGIQLDRRRDWVSERLAVYGGRGDMCLSRL